MRSIIRFSVNNEKNSELRNRLAKVLTDAGYVRNPESTATYEATEISESVLSDTMQKFWKEASNPPEGVSIDHVWTYADNPPTEASSPGTG